MIYRIIVINPGSTTTKVALFENERPLFKVTVDHSLADLQACKNVQEEVNLRYKVIKKITDEHNCDLATVDAFASRGGFLRPVEGGTYLICDQMLADLTAERYGRHSSNIGPFIARRLSYAYGKPALITNPVSVGEYEEWAKITGLPEITRTPTFHVLNQKEVAYRAARQIGKRYDECRFVVAHLGGGMSVGAHEYGRIIDSTSPNQDGAFSITRSGVLPAMKLVSLCYSGKYTWEEIKALLANSAGIYAHTGETNFILLEERAKSDDKIRLLLEAMAYRIAFNICAHAAALCGDIDAVILTGGIAHSKYMVSQIQKRSGFLAPFLIFPGEFEMEGLASGAIRVLSGLEMAKYY